MSRLGFFNPDHPKIDRFEPASITVSQDVYYRELEDFLRHVRDVYYCGVDDFLRHGYGRDASWFRGEKHICEDLPEKLCGSAKTWYESLDSTSKKAVDKNLNEFLDGLAENCKLSKAVADVYLRLEMYTQEDVQRGRSVSTYLHSVARYMDTAGYPSIPRQVLWAWNHLALEFRQQIPKPDSYMTIKGFLRQLEYMEPAWQVQFRAQSPLKPSPLVENTQTRVEKHVQSSADQPAAIHEIVQQIGVEVGAWRKDKELAVFLDETMRLLMIRYNAKEVRGAVKAAIDRQVARFIGEDDLGEIETHQSRNAFFDHDDSDSQSAFISTPDTSTIS